MYGISDPNCPVDYAKLKASVTVHEGTRNLPYTDTTGNISIGIGRNLTVNGVSANEIDLMLDNDLSSAIGTAQTQNWWPHVSRNDARARAMCELVFNMGGHGVSTFTK